MIKTKYNGYVTVEWKRVVLWMVNVSTNQCMVCKAVVTTNTTYKEYYGTSEGESKSRYNNQTQSFRHISHINDTELSKYLWTSKANGTDYHLKWSIKSYASRYKCGTRRCDLCLTEKMLITLADPKVLLNKRTELISKCCHRNKESNNHLNWRGNYLIVCV